MLAVAFGILMTAVLFGTGAAALSDAATEKAAARQRTRTAGIGVTLVLASALLALQLLNAQ